MLLEFKADPHVLNKEGRTPLDVAIACGHDRVVRLVLMAATTSACTSEGRM